MRALMLILAALILSGCNPDQDTYTLYRTSVLASMRVHVATFDVGDPDCGGSSVPCGGYNRGNCEMVVRYLTQQPEVPEGYYWCEPGKFRR